MKDDIEIFPCLPENEREVVSILSDANLPTEDLSSKMLKNFLVARKKGGVTAGIIGLEPCGRSGLLRSLVVLPPFRGSGLGKRLVSGIESHARRMGIEKLFLLTMTAADFFPGLGYQVIRRGQAPQAIADTTEFKSLCPESAVCMFKSL